MGKLFRFRTALLFNFLKMGQAGNSTTYTGYGALSFGEGFRL